jgi:hypothetical protein
MTRDFSNQRQDDRRPSSRHTSSGNFREERPSNSQRPRLSRDTVDRAWENGANRTHADYHPRQTPNTPPAQRQGRPSSGFERSQPSQNRRPYEARQDNYRGPSAGSPRPGYQQRRPMSPGDSPRRFEEPGQRTPASPSGFNNERGPRERDQRGPSPNYQDRNRPGQYQDERTPRFRPAGPGPAPRNNYRPENRPGSFEQNERDQQNFARGPRPANPGNSTPRDAYNPRWQSRPAVQRSYQAEQNEYQAPRRDYPPAQREPQGPRPGYRERSYERPATEQFEGDYERFNTYENRPTGERRQPAYEPPVTKLPDGRVLKGPQQVQRKQARFWNNATDETETLVPRQSAAPEHAETAAETDTSDRPVTRPARPSKPRALKTVQTTRPTPTMKSKHTAKVNRKKNQPHSAQGPVVRPSQRGYKWPASEEEKP